DPACVSLSLVPSTHPIMAQTSHSRKAAAKAVTFFFVFFTFGALFRYLLKPGVLETYPQARAFAVAFVWIGEKFLQGAAVFCLIGAIATLATLIHDAYGWITGRAAATSTTTPTPADLENGSAPGVDDLAALEAEVAAAEPPAPVAPTRTKPSVLRRILGLVTSSWSFTYVFLSRNVVSLDKPVLENLGATGLFILRGLEIIFVFFLLCGVVGLCVRRGRRTAVAAPVLPTTVSPTATAAEVVFDEAAPATKEEKEYKDVVAEEEKA
ncbi:hypothetical protein B0H11DRAFT_2078756, partial [Mycena galericulata]